MEQPLSNLACNSTMSSKQKSLLFHYIFFTLRQVKRMLKQWEGEASLAVDDELRKQALNSMHWKDFHCQGGAVFAVPYPEWETLLLRLIVAYQTLCDYLDNLCDRASCTDGAAFRQLHESLKDALTPGAPLQEYYSLYPYQDDSGYIAKLVQECQDCLQELPSYPVVYDDVILLAQLYIDLQVHKHIDLEQREPVLINWAEQHLKSYSGVLWQEFAAASGSTLAVFALWGLASQPGITKRECTEIMQAYFPWICGLHILLDYFIDQEEDRQGGDLNFTFYYASQQEMMERLKLFIRESHKNAVLCKQGDFAKTVVEGLLAMYLSDRKVKKLGYHEMARDLLSQSGKGALNTYRICLVVRQFL